jgi:hypothetical protein
MAGHASLVPSHGAAVRPFEYRQGRGQVHFAEGLRRIGGLCTATVSSPLLILGGNRAGYLRVDLGVGCTRLRKHSY